MKKFYAFIFISLFFFSNTCPMRVAVEGDIALEIDRLERENERLEEERERGLAEEVRLKKKFITINRRLSKEKDDTRCCVKVNRCLYYPAIIGTGVFAIVFSCLFLGSFLD